MKKTILLVLLVVLVVHLISCKKSELKNSAVDNSTVIEFGKEMVNTKLSENESGQNKIDFDWSKMNYNMLSSLIFDIQINPEKYEEKRIKMAGNFYTSVYEEKRYFSVLIWDSTGCCPAGLDFIPLADMKYPEDFPESDENIIVTGIFKFTDETKDSLLFYAEEIKVVK